MKRPSEFDKAVRNKMLPLEAEPSAAVWAGIRAETGLVLQPQQGLWAYRIMAAASVIFLLGLAIFLSKQDKTAIDQLANLPKQLTRPTARPKLQAQPYTTKENRKIPQQQAHMPWYNSPDITVENILASKENESPKELKKETPPFFQPKEMFVEQKQNQQTPEPKLPKALHPIEQQDELFADNSQPEPSVSSGNKKVIRIPRLEDLTKENLRKRSRGLLGAIANGAKDYLGIDTKFKQVEAENLKTTAFSANLGFFKVKKVHTTKHPK